MKKFTMAATYTWEESITEEEVRTMVKTVESYAAMRRQEGF